MVVFSVRASVLAVLMTVFVAPCVVSLVLETPGLFVEPQVAQVIRQSVAEVRFGWFTIGYKLEKLFWDVLDHDFILSQELNTNNSSELRGLRLNPWMNYLYLGINIDFFEGKD